MDIPNANQVKSCCADAYGSPWASLILGDSWHPGGLALTEATARLLGLSARDRVLDVAAGNGSSACHLAQRIGCRVDGIEFGAAQVQTATERARRMGLIGQVTFGQADAEDLPVGDASVDVVLCECSLCLFTAPEQAVAEWARVLKSGGRLGLSDVTRSGSLPSLPDSLTTWIGCLAGARAPHDYEALLAQAGFVDIRCQDKSSELSAMIVRIRDLLVAMATLIPNKENGDFRPGRIREVAETLLDAVQDRRLGYAVWTARCF